MMKTILLAGVASLMISGMAQAQDTAVPAGTTVVAASDGWGNAPDFSLTTFEGDEVVLSELGGRPLLLNFWAEWCPPCVAELPMLQEAYEQYGEDVQFLTVNLEKGRMDPGAFLEQRGISIPGGLADNEVGLQYGISGIPATFFISSEGNVLGMKTGAFVDGELPYVLDAMLAYEDSLLVTE